MYNLFINSSNKELLRCRPLNLEVSGDCPIVSLLILAMYTNVEFALSNCQCLANKLAKYQNVLTLLSLYTLFSVAADGQLYLAIKLASTSLRLCMIPV